MAVDVHEPPEMPEDARSGQPTGAWMLNNCGDAAALIGLLQGFERCRNRMALVDHHLVHAVESPRLQERLEYRTVAKLLHTCLRIPYGLNAEVRTSAFADERPRESRLRAALPSVDVAISRSVRLRQPLAAHRSADRDVRRGRPSRPACAPTPSVV